MKFSIIIPVFNVESYLDECLQSILSQDFADYEVLLINDGSKDKSGEICDRYAVQDRRVRVFHQQNKGVGAARNLGINHAIGDYLWFVDGDDKISEYALPTLSKKLNAIQNIDVLGFNFSFFDSDFSEPQPLDKKEFFEPINGNVFLNYYGRLSSCTFIYKKKLIVDNCLGFTSGITTFEDNLFNIEVFNVAERIIQTNDRIYLYRQNRNESAMSASNYKNWLNSVIMILQKLNSMSIKNIDRQNLDILKVSFLFSFLFAYRKEKSSEITELYYNTLYDSVKGIKIHPRMTKETKVETTVFNLLQKNYLQYCDTFFIRILKSFMHRIIY